MATDLTLEEPKTSADDVGIGEYMYGFSDPTDKYVFKSRKGLNREIVASDLRDEGGTRLDAGFPPEGSRNLREEADAHVGRRHVGPRLPGHLLLRQGVRRARRRAGTTFPKTFARPTTAWGSPRRRRSTCRE